MSSGPGGWSPGSHAISELCARPDLGMVIPTLRISRARSSSYRRRDDALSERSLDIEQHHVVKPPVDPGQPTRRQSIA